ncbi:MAG: tetratricopeptide repeat protein [Candidatus Sumerlaeaceae bacterium]
MASVTRPAAEDVALTVQDDLDFGERTTLWFDTNAKLVNILLAAFIIVALGWTVYRWIHQGQQAKASRAYAAVLEQLGTAQAAPDDAKRRDALNAAITAADNAIKNYPSTFVGRQAQLLLGNAHYELASLQAGQQSTALNNARDAYQKYITIAREPQEKAVGNIALAHVLQDQLFITQDQKLTRDAENAFKQASDLAKGTYLDAQAKLGLANMYQALENRQGEAEKLYQAVAQERKVEPAPVSTDSKPVTTAEGEQVLTPGQVDEVKTLQKLSYANMANSALNRLPALKVQK